MNQVNGDSEMAPACWLFLAGGEERAMASASSTILEKAVPEYFSSFSYASGAFQTAASVLELRASESVVL